VVGQVAARDLKPGTLVTGPLVEAVPLAKLGQFVTVTLHRGNVQIKSVGKAMEGGSYGQTIRVKNEATRDVYQVVLTGPQEASMATPPAAAPEAPEKAVAALDAE
jgi:flagella basal body P-ring formation protein FlgA